MVLLFLMAGSSVLFAQQKDSSIFSKPQKIDAAVHTERVARSEQKGDTLIFNAAAYQVSDNADTERLISKMPGISVTDTGVEAGGKTIKHVLLDGLEFFGDDVLPALRNIPADMVKQIEVINRLSDSARETGVDDGEGHLALNVVTKRKKGNVLNRGRIYGNGGVQDNTNTGSKPQVRYIAGGNITRFSDKSTISLIGMSNNISKFNFSNSDIVSGSTSLDASYGSSFKVKALSGISQVHSLGANYTTKNINLTYFFSDISNHNNPQSEKLTMTNTEGKTLSTVTDNHYQAHNGSHRLNGKITLKPTKKQTIIIRPDISYENLSNVRDLYSRYKYIFIDQDDDFRRKQLNTNDTDRHILKASADISYVYRFKKRRRSLTIQGKYNLNWQKGLYHSWEYRWQNNKTYQDAYNADTTDISSSNYSYIQNRCQNSTTHTGTGRVTFTEPISKHSTLSGEYIVTYNNTQGNNLIYPFDDETGQYIQTPKAISSAISSSTYIHQNFRIRYNYSLKKASLITTLTYLNTTYKGSSELPYASNVQRTYHFPLYHLKINLPINKSNVFKFEANGRTSNPGNASLQDIVDRSSSSNVRAGNPNLRPAYLHNLSLSYINTNKKAGTTLSVSGSYSTSASYFCDSLVINNPDFVVMKDENGNDIKLGANNQYTKRINMGGYHKADYKVTFGFPVDFIMCNMNISTQGSIQNIPGMINEEKVPINRNWFQIAARMDSNISKKIDFTLRYHFRYTQNEYNGKFGNVQNNFYTHRASAQLRWVLPLDFTFTGGFVFQQNISTQGQYKDDIYLCDLFIGKRFLKSRRLEFNIGVNDLLNSSLHSYWHTVSATGRSDGQNIGIGRYFSMQCIWNFHAGTRPKKIIK